MMADCQYKQQTIERVDAVCAAQKKEILALREENVMMKHALKSMKEQTQALLEGHFATCRSQYVSKLESQDLKLAKAITMLATVMRGHGVRQQVRSDNRHLRDKLQALESEMKTQDGFNSTHLELKATCDHQAGILASKVAENEGLSLKVIGLERDLAELT